MAMADAFASSEAHYRDQVLAATWGHLAPRRNKKYRGRLVYAVGCYGNDHLNPTVLSCEFAELEDSPWFYSVLTDFLHKQEFEVGCVYEFRGAFRNYRFEGETTLLMDHNTPVQTGNAGGSSARDAS